jgi:regulator of replication initiation timing
MMSSSKTTSKTSATKAVSFHHSVPSSPKERVSLLSINENNYQDIVDQKNRQLAYLQQHITEIRRKHLEVNNGLIQKNVRLNQQLTLISSDCNTMRETIEKLKLENATLKGKNEELQNLVHALVLHRQKSSKENDGQEKEAISILSLTEVADSGGTNTTNGDRWTCQSNEVQGRQDNVNQTDTISEVSKSSPIIITAGIENEEENKEPFENVEKGNEGTESIDTKHMQDETNSTIKYNLVTNEQQCNRIQISEGSIEIDGTIEKIGASINESTNYSHHNNGEAAVRPKRRITKQKNYSEPSIRSKLRRGDATTFGINDISELYKCFDKKLSSSTRKRKRKNVYCV